MEGRAESTTALCAAAAPDCCLRTGDDRRRRRRSSGSGSSSSRGGGGGSARQLAGAEAPPRTRLDACHRAGGVLLDLAHDGVAPAHQRHLLALAQQLCGRGQRPGQVWRAFQTQLQRWGCMAVPAGLPAQHTQRRRCSPPDPPPPQPTCASAWSSQRLLLRCCCLVPTAGFLACRGTSTYSAAAGPLVSRTGTLRWVIWDKGEGQGGQAVM